MRTIEIDGKKVTVELEWEALKSVDSYSKEVRALVQANPGVKKGVVIKAGGVTVVGLVPPGQKVEAPSAAAWLATANHLENVRHRKNDEPETNWIVVERLDEDEYWLCVIKDEVPLPGSDIVDNWEGTALRIQDLVQIGGFIVYSNDEAVQSFVSEASPAQAKNFSAMVQGVKQRNRVRVISGVSPMVLIAVGAVILVGGAWWGYGYYSDIQAAREAQAKQQQQQQQQAIMAARAAADYDRARHQALDTALADAKEDLRRSLSTPSPNDVLGAWADLIDKVSLDHDGWLLDSITCGMGPDFVPFCTVGLKRDEWGINRTLAEDYPSVQFSGDSASYDLRADHPLSSRSDDITSVPRVRSFGLKELSDLQEVKAGGVKHVVNASTDIVKQVNLPPQPGPGGVVARATPGQPAAPTIAPIQMGIATGTVEVDGEKLWQIRDIGEVIDSTAFVVQDLKVSMGGETSGSWKLTTQYYVKTMEKPLVPDLPPLQGQSAAPGTPGTIAPVPSAALGAPSAPASAPAPAVSNSTVQGAPTGAAPPPPATTGLQPFTPVGPGPAPAAPPLPVQAPVQPSIPVGPPR